MHKGDAFALVMQNHAEFVDFMVASSILGTVFVPIDSRTRGDKLQYMLNFAECKGAVVGDNALHEVEAVWHEASSGLRPLRTSQRLPCHQPYSGRADS